MSDTISEMNMQLSRMVWFLSLALSSLVLYQMQLLLYLNDQEIISISSRTVNVSFTLYY